MDDRQFVEALLSIPCWSKNSSSVASNVGAVLSIAFAIAIVTSAMPVSAMVEIFSDVSRGLSDSAAAPFISGLHAALLLMTGASIVGFFFSALRGSERDARGMQESKL
jgi:hypothetical protein